MGEATIRIHVDTAEFDAAIEKIRTVRDYSPPDAHRDCVKWQVPIVWAIVAFVAGALIDEWWRFCLS